MAAQDTTSRHLAAARQMLDELGADPGAQTDVQAKATVAVAHSILVLAEQVAAARVVMATDAAESFAATH